MKTILLEGTELSGKTTLVKSISNALSTNGHKVCTNDGPIYKNSRLVQFPLLAASSFKSSSLKELMYTFSLLADKRPDKIPEYEGVDYFIQERAFPSIIAFSKVFNKWGINKLLWKPLSCMYTHFDFNFALKASPEERYARMNERETLSSLDEFVKLHPLTIINLEKEIEKILSRESNYFVIDTTKMTIEEATQEIVGRVA